MRFHPYNYVQSQQSLHPLWAINYHILAPAQKALAKKLTNYAKHFGKVPTSTLFSHHLNSTNLIFSNDALPATLNPFVANEFDCAGCHSHYIHKDSRHLPEIIK